MPRGYEKSEFGMESEEEVAFRYLFPYPNRFQRLQMLHFSNIRAKTPEAVLGVFRRLYGSKILRYFQEELMLQSVSVDGAGRGEAVELVGGIKRARAEREGEE